MFRVAAVALLLVSGFAIASGDSLNVYGQRYDGKPTTTESPTLKTIDDYKTAVGNCSSATCVGFLISELDKSGLINKTEKQKSKLYDESVNYCKKNEANEKSLCVYRDGHYYIYFGKLVNDKIYR